MIESTPDPMDAFARFVRTIAADNEHVIVGPASMGQRKNHYLVEVVVAAINPTPDRPFVTTSWNFEVKPAGASGTVISAWGTGTSWPNYCGVTFSRSRDVPTNSVSRGRSSANGHVPRQPRCGNSSRCAGGWLPKLDHHTA